MGYRRDNRMWQAGYDYFQNFVAINTALAVSDDSYRTGYEVGFDEGHEEGFEAGVRHGLVIAPAQQPVVIKTESKPDTEAFAKGYNEGWAAGAAEGRYAPPWSPQPYNPGRTISTVSITPPGAYTTWNTDHHFTD